MEMPSEEALGYLWEGAIPLQIHLHESEVTTLPPPPPFLVLGPRVGYLPLLVPLIKPHFSTALPPGDDTIWFDYKGLPLKWYIPTGVLFDILCAEPERPWNLTVHFRGYPAEVLTPCDGEDSVKWSFINSLKEAAYIINGNCKNVMNMSQADQLELWQSVVKGNMESYLRVSSRLKLGPIGDYCVVGTTSASHPRLVTGGSDIAMSNQTGRVAVRLYVRIIEDLDDFEDVTTIDSWDKISYINRPVDIDKEEGKYYTLRSAVKTLLPEFFDDEPLIDEQTLRAQADTSIGDSETVSGEKNSLAEVSSGVSRPELHSTGKSKIKLVRIQGIEPDWDIPFAWVVNNLMHFEFFLHISVFVGVPLDQVNTG